MSDSMPAGNSVPVPKSGGTEWKDGHGPKCKLCGQDRKLKVDKPGTMATNKPQQGVRLRPLKTNIRARRKKDKRYVDFY